MFEAPPANNGELSTSCKNKRIEQKREISSAAATASCGEGALYNCRTRQHTAFVTVTLAAAGYRYSASAIYVEVFATAQPSETAK